MVLPAYYFVILTHLHNLVPLVFVWEWASRLGRTGGRWTFRATQVLWVLVLPLLILGGLDSWISTEAGAVERFVGNGERVIGGAATARSLVTPTPTSPT